MKKNNLATTFGIVILAAGLVLSGAKPAANAAGKSQAAAGSQVSTASGAAGSLKSKTASTAKAEDGSNSAGTKGQTQDGITVTEKKYEREFKKKDGTVYKTISFSYPYAKGTGKAEEEFNQFYQRLLRKWKKGVENNLDDAKEVVEDVSYSDSVDFEVASNDANYISILQTGYEYTLGAHGMPYRYSYIFDAKTGKKVSAASVLGVSKKRLNTMVRGLFLKKYDKLEGTEESPFFADRAYVVDSLNKMDFNRNLSYLKNGKVYFYADPYAVGPYSSGFVEVAVKL